MSGIARSSSRTGAAAFQQKAPRNQSTEQERVAHLEKKIQINDEVLGDLVAEHVVLRKSGTLTGVWVLHDPRDPIVNFVRRWSDKTEIGAGPFIGWLDIVASKFYDSEERYGTVKLSTGRNVSVTADQLRAAVAKVGTAAQRWRKN